MWQRGVPLLAVMSNAVFVLFRDLDALLDAYEGGRKFYLYTGRGPSADALHLGHLVPFMFTQYLQVGSVLLHCYCTLCVSVKLVGRRRLAPRSSSK